MPAAGGIFVVKTDFIVLARVQRRRGEGRRSAPWRPIATAESAAVAETMARLRGAQHPREETLVLGPAALRRRLSSEERERIFEQLSNRTTADVRAAVELHALAMAQLEAEQRSPFKQW